MRKMKKMIQIMNMSVQDNEFSKLKRMMLSSAHEKNDLRLGGEGPKDPQQSFGFSGLFERPLVSMLTHI